MKDLDDTWLYGPFHGDISRITTFTSDLSNDTHLARTTLDVEQRLLPTRSILKRPRISEVLLRGSENLLSRSKGVELESRPFYGDTTKKRVVFREEVEQYAAVEISHIDEDDKDELDHWTETYSSNYSYDDPVEDLLSTTQSLRHHVEQNIKILSSFRTPTSLPPRKTLEQLPPAPLKQPKEDVNLDSPQSSKATSSPTRHHNEPLRFSTLSEWTLLGGDSFFDEEEDWLSPAAAPYVDWKPTIPLPASADITSQPLHRPLRNEISLSEEMRDELTALMRCEELYLETPSSSFSEPSSASTSDTNSSGSSDERDDLNHVVVRDVDEDERNRGGIKGLMEMKQAFVDRVMEDFYLCEKEENLHSLVPPDLRVVGVRGAVA
jgi:hypothetical protein